VTRREPTHRVGEAASPSLSVITPAKRVTSNMSIHARLRGQIRRQSVSEARSVAECPSQTAAQLGVTSPNL